MRTLYEIAVDMIEGRKPTHNECYYALQVYRNMFNIEHRQHREELLKENRTPEWIRKQKAENSFNMFKGALGKSPKEWLGVKEETK
ncbi:hypothetical protein [Virgibacillus salexigens]|uniref:Uncharacterized protein n=1 Tax=Virgibacillus massiliensis TaxID=1462526 RepID=A0A024QHW8_9BACI|nr:hypothetical protein [Virgibacillus massiliensis]CDQ41842.1 hypothetical protein BN990_04221 [Virgibacillus massiliensis]